MPNDSSISPYAGWRVRDDLKRYEGQVFQSPDGKICDGWKEVEKEMQRIRERNGSH